MPGKERKRNRQLSERDRAILRVVGEFRQVTSRQLERLFFTAGAADTRARRCRRTLERLTARGVIKRLPRPIVGTEDLTGGHVYVLPGSKSRRDNEHTLAITELYVALTATGRRFEFQPQPDIWVGRLNFIPDAYVRLWLPDGRRANWFVEIDRHSEWNTDLEGKVKQYVRALDDWPQETFPWVLFVMDEQYRLKAVQRIIERQPAKDHAAFAACMFRDAIAALTGPIRDLTGSSDAGRPLTRLAPFRAS